MSKRKPKTKPSPARNWISVYAWFRKSGQMGDKRKEESKNSCRKFNKEQHKDF